MMMMTVGVVVSSWEIACAHRLKPKSGPSARCFIFPLPLSPVHPPHCPNLSGTALGPNSPIQFIPNTCVCLRNLPQPFSCLAGKTRCIRVVRVIGPLTGPSTETGSHPPTQQEGNQSSCEGRGSFRKLGAYVNILMK